MMNELALNSAEGLRVGLGLRHALAQELLQRKPEGIDWLEIHPENYVRRGGSFARHLAEAREHWPTIPHGLTLGVGSSESFDPAYLKELKRFLDWIDAPWYSDHLCFSNVGDVFLHDLLPVPMNQEALRTCIARVRELQDALERPVAVENISFYSHLVEPELDEATFMLALLEEADALLLLDVNNVYVNAQNHGSDPRAFIDRMPTERVVELHVAGHFRRPDDIVIDTHGESICEGVYALLEHTLQRLGPKPILLERDQNFPPLTELLEEIQQLRNIDERVSAQRSSNPVGNE